MDEVDKLYKVLECQRDRYGSWAKPADKMAYLSQAAEFCKQHELERIVYPLGLLHGYPQTLNISAFRKRVANLPPVVVRTLESDSPSTSDFYKKCIKAIDEAGLRDWRKYGSSRLIPG